MKEQRIVTPDNLDPDVFTVKTVDSKNYITVNARGTNTDCKFEFGPETRTVERVNVYGEPADFIFTEVLNHNQPDKQMFVCTDVIQDGVSLVYILGDGLDQDI